MKPYRVAGIALVLITAAELTSCTDDVTASEPAAGGSSPITGVRPSPTDTQPMSGGFQGGIEGTVRAVGGGARPDLNQGTPAVGAQVQLVSLATGVVVATSTTDAKGHFTMSTRAAEYELVVATAFTGCRLAESDAPAVSLVTLPPFQVLSQNVVCPVH